MPALLLLEPHGYLDMQMQMGDCALATANGDGDGDIAVAGDDLVARVCRPTECRSVENKIMLTVPGHDDRIIVPKMYCGAIVRHKPSGQWLKIPAAIDDANVPVEVSDDFWDD